MLYRLLAHSSAQMFLRTYLLSAALIKLTANLSIPPIPELLFSSLSWPFVTWPGGLSRGKGPACDWVGSDGGRCQFQRGYTFSAGDQGNLEILRGHRGWDVGGFLTPLSVLQTSPPTPPPPNLTQHPAFTLGPALMFDLQLLFVEELEGPFANIT